jgi:hypothetical protein
MQTRSQKLHVVQAELSEVATPALGYDKAPPKGHRARPPPAPHHGSSVARTPRPVNARSSSSARAQSLTTARRSREICEQTGAVDYAF